MFEHILERSFLHLGFAPWAIGLSIYIFWLLGPLQTCVEAHGAVALGRSRARSSANHFPA